MTTINHQFADEHTEEIEVTEKVKAAYEESKQQEKRYYWKTKRQKYRAGLRGGRDCSLELCTEHGYEPQSSAPSPLDELILREEQAAYDEKLLSRLTPNQREVYVMRHVQGFSIVEIMARLKISESAVRDRLNLAYKKTQGKLCNTPEFDRVLSTDK